MTRFELLKLVTSATAALGGGGGGTASEKESANTTFEVPVKLAFSVLDKVR